MFQHTFPSFGHLFHDIGTYSSYSAAAEFFQSAKESFLNDKSFPSLTKENVLEWLFINPAHNTLPTGYSPQQQNYTQTKLEALVEKDIINCKEKRAYFSVVETVSAEMDFLHISCYPSKKFYVGSASWRPRRFGWEFQKVAGSTTSSGVSVVHRNLQTLVSSGIYFRLRTANFKDLSYGRKPVANDTTPSVSKTAIDGRIMTVFMICGALTLCALVALVIEGYNEFSVIAKTYVLYALSLCVKCFNYLGNIKHSKRCYRKRRKCPRISKLVKRA